MKKFNLLLIPFLLASCGSLKPMVHEDFKKPEEVKVVSKEAKVEDDSPMDLLDESEKKEIKKTSKKSVQKEYLEDKEDFDIKNEIAFLKNELNELDPQTISSLREIDEDEMKAQAIKEQLKKEALDVMDESENFEQFVKNEETKTTDGRFEVLKTNSPQMMADLEKKKVIVKDTVIRKPASVEEEKAVKLSQISYGPKNLFYAARKGFPGTIRYLVFHKKLDVNEVDEKNGKTALIHAASNGKIGNVRELLNFKADKSIRDSKGYTALDYAKEKKYKTIIKMLE